MSEGERPPEDLFNDGVRLFLEGKQAYAKAESDHDMQLFGFANSRFLEAANCFKAAADQGLPSAQFNLGHMYEEGFGVYPSAVDAAKWYNKAAEQGDVDAMVLLADFYEDGRGVGRSSSECKKWRELAKQISGGNLQYVLTIKRELSPLDHKFLSSRASKTVIPGLRKSTYPENSPESYLITAFFGAAIGTDAFPGIIESRGSDAPIFIKTHMVTVANAILDAMHAIGMKDEDIERGFVD